MQHPLISQYTLSLTLLCNACYNTCDSTLQPAQVYHSVSEPGSELTRRFRTEWRNARMKTITRSTVSLLASLLLLSAGAQELRAGVAAQPETLDPQATSATSSFQTTKSIYDTLVEVDRDGNIVPSLATGWEISADSLTWTFALNSGVAFHNGDIMTAEDVISTFERILDEDFASPKYAEFENIASVTAPDPHTVVFTLGEPTPALLSALAAGWGAILPASLIENGHDFGNDPVGSGPFRFVQWVRDSHLTLERFDDYFRGPAGVDSLRLVFVSDSAIQLQGLITGQFHIIDLPAAADIPQIEAHPDLVTSTGPSGLVIVAALNGRHPPLDDVLVRQALNHAVDKEVIMEVAYGGGNPVGTFMEYGSPWLPADVAPYRYDPERARELLAEAGFASGLELRMLLPQLYPPHVLAGQIIQAQLAEVGVTARIEIVEWGVWLSEVYSDPYDFDITVVGHTGKLDPTGRLGGYDTDTNYVAFEDPELTALLHEAAVSPDWDHRASLYADALRILHDQAPWIYLGTPDNRVTHRAEVEGFWVTPLIDTWDFRSVSIN